MQRYQWPGFKMQLLAELQRQQNQTQFCDTLLQTEGISVPAHSCVLAALSPYLSQKLSASPPPLLGQKRQLKLQTLKAQTLLKLVGLLYSGELEVTGSMEQNDVLSAVHQLGITGLVEGHRGVGVRDGETKKRDFPSRKDKEEGSRGRSDRLTKQDAGVQSDTSTLGSFVSTGTQTDPTCVQPPGQTPALDQEPASSLPHCTMQTQETSLDQHSGSSSVTAIFSLPSGTPDSVTNPTSTSASSSNVTAVPFPPNSYSDSLTPHDNGVHQLSSEGETNQRIGEGRVNGEHQETHTPTEEVRGAGGGHSHEKRQSCMDGKLRSMAKLQQMQQIVEATQISIKVKLRRRTKEKVWEVVNLQDKDNTLAALTSMQQEDSNQKRPESDPPPSASSPPYAQPGSVPFPKTSLLQHGTAEPAAPHSSPASEPQYPSPFGFTPNHSDGSQAVLTPQPPGPVEDTDEQIEKMLEDIMMGLNILPALETGSKRSLHPQQSNKQAPTSCQIQHMENEGVQGLVHAGDGAAGFWGYQDFWTQTGPSSIDTAAGLTNSISPSASLAVPNKRSYLATRNASARHSCQIQQRCSSLTSVQLETVQNQQSQQQSSVTSMGQRGGLSHQGMMTRSKSQTSNQEVATTSAFNFSVQKPHHPGSKEQSSQHDPNLLEFLPLPNRNQTQSPHFLSLLFMDEMRLPPPLSPLKPSSLTSEHQPVLRDSPDDRAETQPQTSQQGPSWLTETPECLRFPFSAITLKDNQSGAQPQDKNSRCRETQPCKDLELIPHGEGTRVVSYQEREKRAISPQVADRESKVGRCKQSDTKVGTRKRKRKETTDGSLPFTEVKVSDGRESQLNLSDCSVSLSCNNVLAEERERANTSSCKSVRLAGKRDEPSTVTESQGTRPPLVRIRTRSFLRRPKETQSHLAQHQNIRPEETQSKANVEQTSALESAPTPKRKRGRPQKLKPGKSRGSSSAVTEQKNNTIQGETHINNSLSKGKKRKRNGGKVEVDPPKTTESSCTTETDLNQNMKPAEKKPPRPRRVSLKEFQKLIKQQHFKTKKSKEIQDKDTNNNKQTSRKAEGEEKAADDFPPDDSAVDVNHNQVEKKAESQRDDRRGSAAEEIGVIDTEQCSVFSLSDLGQEVETLESEQPLRNLLRAQTCDEAQSDTTHQIINGDGSRSDPTQPQEVSLHVGHSLPPQRTEARGCNKLSGCAQGEVDEEEEEEVDVLLYSPDRGPPTVVSESRQEHVDVSPEEDEDDVDVTGDEDY